MPTTRCDNCGNGHEWSWTEAFDKFGFDDGDGLVMTHEVVQVLEEAGYVVEDHQWGMHNTVIFSIKRDGIAQIPDGSAIGYADPREYLPAEIITLLDDKLGGDVEVEQ